METKAFPPDDRDPYIPQIDINEATAPDADRRKVVRAIEARGTLCAMPLVMLWKTSKMDYKTLILATAQPLNACVA
jgi:hypothetical protein